VTHPLLETLSPELRSQFRAAARRRRFSKGEVVFHQGDPGDVLHLVDSGRFAVQVISAAGDAMVMRVISAGEHFGELALASGEPTRNATVFALDRAATLSIHRRDFEELRRRAPGVDRLLVGALAQRVRAETQAAMELAFVPAAVRVYRRLLALTSSQTELADLPITVAITQEMLAGLAGTTRATANRAVRALASQRIVELRRGEVVILDHDRLKHAASD
jgi:CRP/FNR family transcriptional regulator, cyclic AMP receptor protein